MMGRSLFVMLGLLLWGTLQVGCAEMCAGQLGKCDYHLEITDEKRSLQSVYGTTRCEKRVAQGATGTQNFRVALVDDNLNSAEAIGPDGLAQEPYFLSTKDFTVYPTDTPDSEIVVLDATTGKKVPGASAAVQVLQQDESLAIQPNPRHLALYQAADNKRVPRAHYLALDMSNAAAAYDVNNLRTKGIVKWLYDGPFNTDSVRGDYDIFAALLIRNDTLNNKDKLTQSCLGRNDDQYVPTNMGGFVYTTKESIDCLAKAFLKLTNKDAVGFTPMYAAIQSAAIDLRNHARDDGTLLYNPTLTVISLSRDVSFHDKNVPSKLALADKAIRGIRWPDTDDPKTADFVPLNMIMSPRPSRVSQSNWTKYVDELCSLVRAGGVDANRYWGNMFIMIPPTDEKTRLDEQIRQNLHASRHMAKGYIEFKVQYQLRGTTPGKRYLVRFKPKVRLLGTQNDATTTPYLTITVIP